MGNLANVGQQGERVIARNHFNGPFQSQATLLEGPREKRNWQGQGNAPKTGAVKITPSAVRSRLSSEDSKSQSVGLAMVVESPENAKESFGLIAGIIMNSTNEGFRLSAAVAAVHIYETGNGYNANAILQALIEATGKEKDPEIRKSFGTAITSISNSILNAKREERPPVYFASCHFETLFGQVISSLSENSPAHDFMLGTALMRLAKLSGRTDLAPAILDAMKELDLSFGMGRPFLLFKIPGELDVDAKAWAANRKIVPELKVLFEAGFDAYGGLVALKEVSRFMQGHGSHNGSDG